jgi:putative peptidoglycan lipid II flippase
VRRLGNLLRPAALITLISLVGQGVGFVTQQFLASYYGVGKELDAFLASLTLPQYATTILLGSLASVFIPVFIRTQTARGPEEAWKLASAVINLTAVLLGLVSLAAMVASPWLIRTTTPGLDSDQLALAARMARIVWPTVCLASFITLLSSLYQVAGAFSWQAITPVVGSVVNLALIILLSGTMGGVALAVAYTASFVIQAVLLVPVLAARGNGFSLRTFRHDDAAMVLRLLAPLVLSSMICKITPVLDRYLASSMPEGSISSIGYASRIMTFIASVLSAGIGTVIFPKLSSFSAADDVDGMRAAIVKGLKQVWVFVAPAIAIGIVGAGPFIALLLQRGKFTRADSAAVSSLLQIYLLAVAGATLGSVTSKVFYAKQRSNLVSVVGVVESLLYVGYTTALARAYGLHGIAIGYVIYFTLSVLWQVVVIDRYFEGFVRSALPFFLKVGAAAAAAGLAAWGVASGIEAGLIPRMAVIAGVGAVVYLGAAKLLRVEDLRSIFRDDAPARASRPGPPAGA